MTPTASGKILWQSDGAIRRIRLNVPARLNALDEEMLGAIEDLFREWSNEASASVVVLDSATPKAFCVGADLERLSTFDAAVMRHWEMLGNRVLTSMEASRLVSVASVSGHVLGGGLTLALACDFRIAADPAGFAQPEIELGWIPGWGGVRRLARVAGTAVARRLCMTGERFDAAAASRYGVVDRVAPAAELETRTAEFVAGLAARSSAALEAIKVLSAGDGSLPSVFDAAVNSALLEDPRGQAALRGFLAKKGPRKS